ncbi:hypothetical protein IKD60_00385 [Candidatus Saccharibacteria bacterium]|nr:hypothetical protein [Candidatus Saccharibacteria bacterium]
MVSEQFLTLLPGDFETNLIIPKIVTHLEKDETGCFGEIVVTGDVSHYRWTDNPIIEIFRSVEQKTRSDDVLPLTAGCPFYTAATGTTKCRFLPNNSIGYTGAQFETAFTDSLEKVREPFEALLVNFFNEEDGGFRDYQIYHELLAVVDNGNSSKDQIDEIRDLCNQSIKEFILKNDYALPRHRALNPPRIEQPQDLLAQLINRVKEH